MRTIRETICQYKEIKNDEYVAPEGKDKAWPKAEAVVLSLEVVLKPAKKIIKEAFTITILSTL